MNLLAGSTGFLGNDILKKLGNIESQTIALSRRVIPSLPDNAQELIVDQDARGKNAGGLLIEETLRLAKNRDCKEFGLYLLESTKHNQPFYEKYGFVKIGEEMRQTL